MLETLETVKAVSSAALTVRAQELSPTNNGTLKYPVIMPREDVDSTKLSELIETDFRPVAARREWNGSGQRLVFKAPSLQSLSFTPIESDTLIDEQELETLDQRYDGNQQMVIDRLKVDIPKRSTSLVEMNYRRLEADVFDAWFRGALIQKNPQTNQVYTLSFGVASGRIQTAQTPWNPSNSYANFIAWAKDGRKSVLNGIIGAMSSTFLIETILNSAPNLANGMKMTLDQLNDDIRARLGFAFALVPNDETADFPSNGGKDMQRSRYFAASKIALIPATGRVGKTAFAPVRRARELAAEVPEAKIDIRGVSVFKFPKQNNKSLQIEAQLNAFPVPNENRVWVMDTQLS